MTTVAATTVRTAEPRRGVARLVVGAALWVGLGLIGGLTLCLTVPTLFGYSALTVVTGSMEPSIEVGSVVLSERISPLEARPGDIVTFRDPDGDGRLLTHRVRSVRYEGDVAYVTTIGDANDVPERWTVPSGGTVGRVAYHLPKVGYVREAISTPLARLAMLGLVGALALWLLFDIWRPRGGRYWR